jgi:hypothetical protein
MEILHETKDANHNGFLSQVFSTSEESKAEILNVVQYALLGVIPVVVLNKSIHRFIPEADPDKSSLELLAETFIQIVIMFCGIIIIHRMVVYVPTYSGFKYESLTLTNVVLAFLVLVLSIQTKLGMKVNILVDRVNDLWEGTSSSHDKKVNVRQVVRTSQPIGGGHAPSQADYLDHSQVQANVFPAAPVATTRQKSPMEGYDTMMGRSGGMTETDFSPAPMAANSLLGSTF